MSMISQQKYIEAGNAIVWEYTIKKLRWKLKKIYCMVKSFDKN